jgi:tight adherence protein B
VVNGSVVFALLSAAVAAAPPVRGRDRRLHTMFGSGEASASRPNRFTELLHGDLPRSVRWSIVVVVSIAIGCLTGPAAGTAAALVVAAAMSTLATGLERSRTRRTDDAALEAVGALSGELRAGLSPSVALRAAAAAVGEPTAALLREAASTVALGGDAASILAPETAGVGAGRPDDGGAVPGLRRIAAAWRVSVHSGASLGEVLDRVESDLRSDRAHLRRIDAELAGPRATAVLLAALPALGLGLGATMGAHPMRVLLHTVPGQLALVTGAGLDALGVWWTARIIGAAQAAG